MQTDASGAQPELSSTPLRSNKSKSDSAMSSTAVATSHSASESQLKCETCHKAFKHKGSLKRHMELHDQTSVPKHVCHLCKRRFRQKSNLVLHYKVHFDDRPFSCPFCKKLFKYKVTLKKHVLQSCPNSSQFLAGKSSNFLSDYIKQIEPFSAPPAQPTGARILNATIEQTLNAQFPKGKPLKPFQATNAPVANAIPTVPLAQMAAAAQAFPSVMHGMRRDHPNAVFFPQQQYGATAAYPSAYPLANQYMPTSQPQRPQHPQAPQQYQTTLANTMSTVVGDGIHQQGVVQKQLQMQPQQQPQTHALQAQIPMSTPAQYGQQLPQHQAQMQMHHQFQQHQHQQMQNQFHRQTQLAQQSQQARGPAQYQNLLHSIPTSQAALGTFPQNQTTASVATMPMNNVTQSSYYQS